MMSSTLGQVVLPVLRLATVVLVAGPAFAQTFVELAPQSVQVDSSDRESIFIRKFDTTMASGQWRFGVLFDHHKTGGSGHRAAVDGRLSIHPNQGAPGEMYVGVDGMCFTYGGGACFGMNAYAQSLPWRPSYHRARGC